MEFPFEYITPDIKLFRNQGKEFKMEVVFDCHMLVWFISGETRIHQADQTYLFKAGDIFLIPRNQLATIINYPQAGSPYTSVVMHLSTAQLRAFYADLNVKTYGSATQNILKLDKHPLLESCLASLIPYFDVLEKFPGNIASLKITEAISILRTVDKSVDEILANFDEPDKIDLADFMEKNFMFNMPLEKFGYLTGRSLTTFKRDFYKIYDRTPQRWLTQKRLELAHYQLSEKKRKPVEVYLETGFENLSHFSYAFKKQFGMTPTALASRYKIGNG